MGLSVSDSLVVYWKKVAEKSDTIRSLENKKYDNLDKINKNLKNSLNANRKKYRKTAICVGVGGTLLGFILGVLFS